MKSQFAIGLIASLLAALTAHSANAGTTPYVCTVKSTSDGGDKNKLFLNIDGYFDSSSDYVFNAPLGIINTSRDQALILDRKKVLKVLGTPKFEDSLDAQNSPGGLELSVEDFLRFPAPNDPNLSLVLNNLCIYFVKEQGKLKGARLHITAKKSYSANGSGLRIGVWYRWEILVKEALAGATNQTVGKRNFNFKFHARAAQLEVEKFEIGYDVNNNDNIDGGEIAEVTPFYQDGGINPLYAVLSPNPTDCIDIDFSVNKKIVEHHIGEVGATKKLYLDKEADVDVFKNIITHLTRPKSGVQFCAGSCSGYMLSASNGG